jgi:hypothetical protein
MVRKYLVITILTILLFGTISSFLVSYNYSGIGSSSSSYNSAFAAKAQKEAGNDNSNNKLEDPETLKQQEKVMQLSQEATNARLDAKLAKYAANNATENAQSLLSAALEADWEVKKLQGTAEKGSENKDLLTAALTDAEEKHHTAKLAENNAKALSDKADVLDKAADKAEKLASRAQKQLETSAAKISNNGGTGTKGQANTDNSNLNSKSTKEEVYSKNSKNESAQDTNSLIQSSHNQSTESPPVQPQSTAENKDENTSSNNDKQLVKENGIQKGKSASTGKKISESNSGGVNTIAGENFSDMNTGSNTNTNINTNARDLEHQSHAGNITDFGQILAQAEHNAHNINANVTGPPAPEENKTVVAGANSVSGSNALTQNSTDLKDTQSPQPVNMSSRANTSLTGVDSPPSQSQNMSALDEGIQTGNDTAGNNTTRNSTGNSTINVVPIGKPNNNSAVSTTVNSTHPYQENAICNIAIENSTSSSTISSGFNMSTNKQDDGGCYPSDSTSGKFRYLVWSEGDEDNRFILFKRSTDGGKTFDNAITLSGNSPSAVFNPKLSSEGNNVFVVWQGDSNSGNQDILMRKSTDNGKTFGSVINLSNDHAGSGNPEINVNASSVYVVWDGTTPGNNEIFYRRSLNNGSNFDSIRNLSNDGGVSYEPKVVINKKALEVYWRDFRNGHEDILVKKSINEGKTFDVLQKINKDILGLWKDRGVLDLRLNR